MIILFKKKYIYNFAFTLALCIATLMIFAGEYDVKETMALPLSNKIIVIDPGHGSPDGGATGIGGSLEKDINLKIAKKLGSYIQQSGARVIYTRETDSSIADDLNKRIRDIKRSDMKNRKKIRDNSNADMFVSIHVNKFTDSAYSGAQVFYQGKSPESKLLAENIQKHIHDFADNTDSREAKDSKKDIFILNDSQIPSVLVECGFISNREEEKKLLSDSYTDKISFSIYSGILQYISN